VPSHLVVDLAEHSSSLFDWSDAELTRLTAEVAVAVVDVAARGLYITEPEFPALDAAVAKWAATALPLIRRALVP